MTEQPATALRRKDRTRRKENEVFDLHDGSARGLADIRSRRAQFVREYLVDLSPRNAAIRAGYAIDKADQTAALLMKMPHIRDAIQRALASRSRRTGVNADRVLDRLGNLAFGDRREVFNPDGSLKLPGELTPDQAALVSAVKTRRIVEVNPDTGKMHNVEIMEMKLVEQVPVHALLMRHLGMLNDKISIDVHGSLAEQLEAARARREGGAADVEDSGTMTPAEIAELEAEEGRLIEGEVVDDDLDGLSPEARALMGVP